MFRVCIIRFVFRINQYPPYLDGGWLMGTEKRCDPGVRCWGRDYGRERSQARQYSW